MEKIHLVPLQRQTLRIGSTTGLNQQYDRYPQVRRRWFKDTVFGVHGEHSLEWPLFTLIEVLHIGCWILANVLSFERKLEQAM